MESISKENSVRSKATMNDFHDLHFLYRNKSQMSILSTLDFCTFHLSMRLFLHNIDLSIPANS